MRGAERRDAPAGTFVFVSSGVRRTAFAEEAGTTIVSIGGVSCRPYGPIGWELWVPLRPLSEAGAYEVVVARGRELIEAHLHSALPLLFYEVACCESLTGRTADAIEHVRRAIALSEQFRRYAREDPDLDPIHGEPAFETLLAG